MIKFYETVLEVLKQDPRFFAEDGTLLRNAVYEAAMQMDTNLIHLLLSNDETKKQFFKEVDGISVFDKIEFGWVVNNREFLPDSYTRFKNKIGLADENGDMISSSGKVELVFPYKDCVLEGGQTKEEQNRDEIFYNETLASDEIDRLFYPKSLVNAKRICNNSEEITVKLEKDDNILIKGNNLLVLSSLKKRFSGKVKMAYWDVPYNTGSDSFGYNDKFSRSSWLIFIKNRVEQLLPLLDNQSGVLLIHCSFHQYAYLKVLLDEIIGNHVMTFNVLVRHPERILTADKDFNDVIEYVLVYSKSSQYKMPKIEEEKDVNDYTWEVEELSEGTPITFDGKKGYIFKPDEYILRKTTPAKENFKIITVRGSIKEKVSSGRFYVKYLHPIKDSYPPKTLFKVDDIGDDMYDFRYFYLPPEGNKNGAYLQGMPTSSTKTYKPYPNFLDFVQSYNAVNSEGIVEFRNGKKPEDLIAYLMKIFTCEKDMVLDAFAGSATTATVALKLDRQFITIEQMDYAETITKRRLVGVINGLENEILSEEEYIGGGSFVYCELAKANQNYVEEIQSVDNAEDIKDIYSRIIATGYISSKVNPKDINANAEDFDALTLDEQKRLLMELLDKNLLYVNYCDIDDEEYGISDADKAFTRSFYEEV